MNRQDSMAETKHKYKSDPQKKRHNGTVSIFFTETQLCLKCKTLSNHEICRKLDQNHMNNKKVTDGFVEGNG